MAVIPVDRQSAEQHPNVMKLGRRGIIAFDGGKITYNLAGKPRAYPWTDNTPEEWVRAQTIAFLILERGYPANRIKTEHLVPRRTQRDRADVVVFEDDTCKSPYLIVENKAFGQSSQAREQGIDQVFGNANSLRAHFALYDEGGVSEVYDVGNYPSLERVKNRLGDRDAIPMQYGNPLKYKLIAGTRKDIRPVSAQELSTRIRRAHSAIWAGGRRDPLQAFDEWSKLLFAKVIDERSTKTNEHRQFQVGAQETTASVASRIHSLFDEAARQDPSIFSHDSRIELPDEKIADVVEGMQDVSLTQTDMDSIGSAFETFFGSVFRGELGQYFTMRPLVRFIVAALDIGDKDVVLDPTAGSGGFLLEVLMQVGRRIKMEYNGQPHDKIERIRIDFCLHRVFGIEIHAMLARICKINLLLHNDGHTHIEGDRSCLDCTFNLRRLQHWGGQFTKVVGNPPFGDEVKEGDRDLLGDNSLGNFVVAHGRRKVTSEQLIVERSIEFLEPGGTMGLIVPDGLLNNQGEQSNCPQFRRFLARAGFIRAIISLPDHAFRRSGAQNKTSILIFQKFSEQESQRFSAHFDSMRQSGESEDEAIVFAHNRLGHLVFLAEANAVGYSPSGHPIEANDLYKDVRLDTSPTTRSSVSSILAQYMIFLASPADYRGYLRPDCISIRLSDLWKAHRSRRIDPKYHIFKRHKNRPAPSEWITAKMGDVMRRRPAPALTFDRPERLFRVMTLSQTGEIRDREAGKGRTPPEWLGMYLADSSSKWFSARSGDVVFSSIDLWKGCIAVVPDEFDGALVTKEFPIYEVTDDRLSATFLAMLLRSRHYQRAFRAITTGHSNRRRTQEDDFENLEIAFPPSRSEQCSLIREMVALRRKMQVNTKALVEAASEFDHAIDGRSDEILPHVDVEPDK